MASSENSFNALREKFSIATTDNNDVDIVQMRKLARLIREDEIHNESPVFHRQAQLSRQFGYFRPTEFMLYDKTSSKDKRSAKEFEFLNASGVCLQLADAG